MILALDCTLLNMKRSGFSLFFWRLLIRMIVLVVPVGLVLLSNQVDWIKREWSFRSLVEGMRCHYQGWGSLQFSYQFAIFISVCNSHFLVGVQFLLGRLQFSYGFAIFIWVCNFHISLQFSRHDSRTSYVHDFIWIPMYLWTLTHNPTSAMVLRGRDKEKLELSKIDYYLLLKSSNR
jgi:hypothetical protein